MSALAEWLAAEGNDIHDNNRLLDAIQTRNVNVLKEILENPVDCRLGYQDTPILSVAALSGDCDMVNYLIASGCDSANVDKMGRTALDMLLWWNKFDLTDDDEERRRLEVINILLATYSNAVETVFLNANHESKESPFLLACRFGSDAIIMRFLDLLGNNNSIPMDHVIGYRGNNLFHYLLDYYTDDSPPSRLETAKTAIDKFPYSHQLIDAKNNYGETPLHLLLQRNGGDYDGVISLANLFLQYGALPDSRDESGITYLDRAIWLREASVVETILRAGCRTDNFVDRSPLSSLLRCTDKSTICIIELLLAFGYDLQKELFLYTIDERPIEFTSPEYVKRCDTSGMNLDLLEALRELRRSNKMLSLKRQCRDTIRRHLKGKADEVIRNLTCIPPPVKSFLLVENERPLLEISESEVDDEEARQ